jgi:signal transduction histidine kinase
MSGGLKLPTTIYVESLDLNRFTGSTYEEDLYLRFRAKYREKPIGVIVAIGDASLDYVLRWRPALWPDIPVAFAMVEEATVARSNLPSDVTGRIMKLSLTDAITAARAVVPGLKRVVLVGDPWEKQTVFRHWKDQIPTIAADVEIDQMIGLTMRELRQRVATLPDHTAIVYTAIYSDGEGTYYPPADAIALVAETANRPIVVPTVTNIGRGAIGGFVLTPHLIGQSAAELALRILGGESASSIPIRMGNVVRPVFDWRQMQRWGVSESNLPAGSEIQFRDPTGWERYRTQLLAIFAAFLVQTALISWLIYEHRRRNRAEVVARNSMSELAHLNRVATAGELSASIAHEVNQPLTGIVTRVMAARRWLAAEKPDIDKARAALDAIETAGRRASDIVASVHAMFKRDTKDKSQVDINKLIWTVLGLVYIDLRNNDIDLQTQLDDQLPTVLGNHVQLQQVILNLVMNAIDAMRSVQRRVLRVKSELNGGDRVHISIEDSGIGIDPSKLDEIFKPLFTTKAQGMGMGLSICHSIIESHNGRIWVAAAAHGGAIFQFELPAGVEKANGGTIAA